MKIAQLVFTQKILGENLFNAQPASMGEIVVLACVFADLVSNGMCKVSASLC